MKNKKIKVLHIYKQYYPDSYGGLENTILQISQSTKKLGISSTILTMSKAPDPKILKRSEGTVIRFPVLCEIASTPIGLTILRDFSTIASRFDILHFHFPWPFGDFLQLMSFHNKPTVITYHSDVVRQKFIKAFYKPIMKQFLSKADKIVVTSPNYLDSSADLQAYKKKCCIIPIGIEESNLRPPQTCLERWKGKYGERFVLFVGVLRYYKGLQFLLDAAKKFKYNIVIVGSGPMEKDLKQQKKDNNLDNVHFAGYLPDEDKAALLQLCSVLVFPSHLRSEAFGVSLLEGAMFGKPLISAEIKTGTTYINQHNITGIVVSPEDPYALQVAMLKICDNPDLAQIMGKKSRERFEDLFTAQKMGALYQKLYVQMTV